MGGVCKPNVTHVTLSTRYVRERGTWPARDARTVNRNFGGAPWTVTTIMGGFPTLGKEDSSTPAPQSYQNQNYQNREAMIATQ